MPELPGADRPRGTPFSPSATHDARQQHPEHQEQPEREVQPGGLEVDHRDGARLAGRAKLGRPDDLRKQRQRQDREERRRR